MASSTTLGAMTVEDTHSAVPSVRKVRSSISTGASVAGTDSVLVGRGSVYTGFEDASAVILPLCRPPFPRRTNVKAIAAPTTMSTAAAAAA